MIKNTINKKYLNTNKVGKGDREDRVVGREDFIKKMAFEQRLE